MATSTVRKRAPAGAVPLLQNGDRLTREEFERRYEALPNVKKAELVKGIVYMPSPVRIAHHGEPQQVVSAWLVAYLVRHPEIQGAENATVRLDNDDEFQPDGLLRKREGGTSRISEDGYVEG